MKNLSCGVLFHCFNKMFVESIVSGMGTICGAGFETPAEVLHLKKKLLVVPMKNQYEQQCNAAAIRKLGIPVIKKIKRKSTEKIKQWLEEPCPELEVPHITEKAVRKLMKKYHQEF